MQWQRRQIMGMALATPFVASKLFAQAAPALSPVATLGINTHLAQGANPQRVLSALNFLGIRHIRDGTPQGATDVRFLSVLQSGVQLTAVTGPRAPLAQTIAGLEGLVQALPGCLAAIEGPNEINNFPITYKGQSGLAAAMAFQTDLYQAVEASSVLRDIPVIAFTDVALRVCPSDFLNFHPYPKGGRTITIPLAQILQSVAVSTSPTEPIEFTEFGYDTITVTQQQQSDLLIDGWNEAMAAGIRRVFIYQLSDFYADANPLQPSPVNHFGVFDLSYQPKTSALAIAQLLRS